MKLPSNQLRLCKKTLPKEEIGLVWERPLVLNGDKAMLRHWVVQRIAERAIQILEQEDDSSGKS